MKKKARVVQTFLSCYWKTFAARVNFFQSRYTIAMVYRLMFFMYCRVSRYIPQTRLSTLRHAISPTRHRKNCLFGGFGLEMAILPSIAWGNRISQGVDSRSSQISMPCIPCSWVANHEGLKEEKFALTCATPRNLAQPCASHAPVRITPHQNIKDHLNC